MSYIVTPAIAIIHSGSLFSATALASFQIGTTLPKMRFGVQKCHIEAYNVSGFVSSPSISIGTNATSYNNIIAARATGLSVSNTVFLPVPANNTLSIPAGTAIFIAITTAASATVFQLKVTITGFYY